MIRSFTPRTGYRAFCVALLGLSLVLRLVGPMAGLPAKDGYVAICAGTQIVYISLAEAGLDGPLDEKAPAPPSDPCPWFAQFHAIDVAAAPVLARAETYASLVRLPPDGAPAAGLLPASFRARAPPVPGA